MKVNFKKQVTKDTFYTLEPFNRILILFNLSSVYRKEKKLVVSSWSFIRSFIHIFVFGSVNFFVLPYKINIKHKDGVGPNNTIKIKFSDSIEMTYLLGYYMHVFDLYQLYKYGREKYLKYYEIYDSIDKILGMKSYDEIRKLISTVVGVSTVIFCITSTIDFFAWVEGYGFTTPFFYILDYLYFYLNMLSMFDVVAHVVQLEFRLEMMKQLLQDYYNSNGIKSFDDDKILAIKSVKEINRLDLLQSLSHNHYIEAIEFSRCYLLLLEQTKYINTMFGIRILVFCINSLFNMIIMFNIAIRLVIGTLTTPLGAVYIPAIFSLISVVSWAYIIIIVTNRAEMTYRQSEEVLEMIDLILINKNNSNKLKATLTELRNLIVTRPIKFHAAFFFNVDYTILVSMASVVVTYTIIMLQNMQ